MRLIDELEQLLAGEQSLFRAQLLREDIARLRKLESLARSCKDLDAFKKAGMRIGWTPGDARTHELREPLEELLGAIYANDESRATQAWNALHRTRVERLVGCLSTPVPKPAE
jgi:hypothetical protein